MLYKKNYIQNEYIACFLCITMCAYAQSIGDCVVLFCTIPFSILLLYGNLPASQR